jgi:hypothetical protein
MSGTSHRFAILPVVLAAILLASGCSAGSDPTPAKAGTRTNTSTSAPSPTAPSASAPDITAPRVGQCWNATVAVSLAFAWEGEAAVSCAQPHNALTFGVVRVPAGFDYAKVKSIGDANHSFERIGKIIPAGETRCGYRASLRYVGHALEKPLGFALFVYVPTEAQYAAGARWVRCDLSVRKGAGYRTLPTSLKAAVSANPAAYLACVAGSVASGPTASKFTDCTKDRHWIASRVFFQATSAHQPFPGANVMRSRAHRDCAPYATDGWASFARTAKRWSAGNSFILCFKAR